MTNPRILIVTPGVKYLPQSMGKMSSYHSPIWGGADDIATTLIRSLFENGVDVHVALPEYNRTTTMKLSTGIRQDLDTTQWNLNENRIHLAKVQNFFDLEHTNYGGELKNKSFALNFQQEVINNIVPRVQPDLIHCNDWMTGIIPSMARRLGIPSLLTIHNICPEKCTLSLNDYIGLNTKFLDHNLFHYCGHSIYEDFRYSNPADFLSSGVSNAHFINTVSQTFLMEIICGRHPWINNRLNQEIYKKWKAGYAVGILNTPDSSFNPAKDKALFHNYGAKNHYPAKQYNKTFLQQKLGLIVDSKAPLFFWPFPLDIIENRGLLLSEILFDVVYRNRYQNIEMVFVSSGEYKKYFQDIVASYQLNNRVSVCNLDEHLSRLAYGGCDFMVILSPYGSCGFLQTAQIIGSLYGALPVAQDTGGLKETVIQMDINNSTGNGFVFKNFDTNGLSRAINEAMDFYNLPLELKTQQIERVMTQSTASFNSSIMASQYIQLYEEILKHPLGLSVDIERLFMPCSQNNH